MRQTDHVDARPLSSGERGLLDELLMLEVPGEDDLRHQLDAVEVFSSCDCGCGSLGFVHPDRTGHEEERRMLWPAEGELLDASGESVGGLILFTKGGLLDDLEVYSFGDPLPLPARGEVRMGVIDR